MAELHTTERELNPELGVEANFICQLVCFGVWQQVCIEIKYVLPGYTVDITPKSKRRSSVTCLHSKSNLRQVTSTRRQVFIIEGHGHAIVVAGKFRKHSFYIKPFNKH